MRPTSPARRRHADQGGRDPERRPTLAPSRSCSTSSRRTRSSSPPSLQVFLHRFPRDRYAGWVRRVRQGGGQDPFSKKVLAEVDFHAGRGRADRRLLCGRDKCGAPPRTLNEDTAPKARALPLSPKLGKKATFRFRVSDNSGKARALVATRARPVREPDDAVAEVGPAVRRVGRWRVPGRWSPGGSASACSGPTRRQRGPTSRAELVLKSARREEDGVQAARWRVTATHLVAGLQASVAAKRSDRPRMNEERRTTTSSQFCVDDERHAGFQGEVGEGRAREARPPSSPCVERPEGGCGACRATRSPAATCPRRVAELAPRAKRAHVDPMRRLEDLAAHPGREKSRAVRCYGIRDPRGRDGGQARPPARLPKARVAGPGGERRLASSILVCQRSPTERCEQVEEARRIGEVARPSRGGRCPTARPSSIVRSTMTGNGNVRTRARIPIDASECLISSA